MTAIKNPTKSWFTESSFNRFSKQTKDYTFGENRRQQQTHNFFIDDLKLYSMIMNNIKHQHHNHSFQGHCYDVWRQQMCVFTLRKKKKLSNLDR